MSKACRAKPPERLQPVRISSTAWYYEDSDGISIYAEERYPDGRLITVITTKIPWWKLERSMARQRRRSR
jgi:hypothetical protein